MDIELMLDKSSLNQLIIVMTTESDLPKAQFLSKSILEKRLAACISLREIYSYYWWKESLESNKEIELLMKTKKSNLASLLNEINQLHSYDVPEILYGPISSSDAYMKWVNETAL